VVDISKNKVTIKWKLNQIMFEKGVKNKDLVKWTGLHTNTISKLKNSRLMPERLERKTLDLLCKALDVEPGDLLTYESDSESEHFD
jgi:putative transcriptional regulator